MNNAWNVIWFEAGKKKLRGPFEGNMPRESGAISFGKKLKSKGIPTENIHIVSRRRAFAPPLKLRHPPNPGMMWCPYCLKWREFTERSIRRDGLRSPLLWRCPICTISIKDHYVRMFNTLMVEKLDARSALKKKPMPTKDTIKKRIARGK